MEKVKIVVSDTAVLYPPLWGGPKRIWNLFNQLNKDIFDIDYVGIDISSVHKGYTVKKIAPNFREFLTFLPYHSQIWDFFEDTFWDDITLPLFSYLMPHTIKEYKNILDNLKADIVVTSHPWAGNCINKDNKTLFIYDAHNCEFHLMKQIIKKNLLGKIISQWVKRIEEKVCKKSDLILVCSEYDARIFRKIYGVNEAKIRFISNGTNIYPLPDKLTRQQAKKKLGLFEKPIIIFIGSYYKPNIEAARFIIENLAYKLKKYTFVIAGSVKLYFEFRRIPNNVHLFPKKGNKCKDEELDLLLKASDIAINPRIAGSGTSIKLLDYLAYGIPSITTPIGKRGLDLKNMENIYISSINEFLKAIDHILSDTSLYNKLKFGGYKLVTEKYNWRDISSNLEEIILNYLDNSK